MLSKNNLLNTILNNNIDFLKKNDQISKNIIIESINNGTMVLLGNINHKNVKPVLIGQPAKVKVNANIGTSPLICSHKEEMEKLQILEKAGADTYMDLSIGGDLDAIRKDMINLSSLPIGTVPLYAAAKHNADKGRTIEQLDFEEVFDEIEKQAEMGVDFMTIHTGITREAAAYAEKNRILGVVSRGGSMISRWILKNNKENPLFTEFDRIVKIAAKHNVTLSLGDSLRPGACADAGDYPQISEVSHLGIQAKYAFENGVQVMIEGPGHVSLDEVESQIKTIKKLTYNAPLYILGPLVIDNSPGYDHISGAIGAAAAVMAGADFLCYLTPAEHLTLPNKEDVYNGVMASKIAAMAGDTALKRKYALDMQNNMSKMRQKLDWQGMKEYALDKDIIDKRRESHKDKAECAMCGEFCSVKLQHNN